MVDGACAALLIVLAVLAAYWPAMSGGFLWDDDIWITEDPTGSTARLIRADDGLYSIWFTTQATDYWPLTNTAFWLQWRLWGMDPTGYRVTNILLHAVGSVLVWRVLRLLQVPGAWLGAVLFAIHPVTVASVAWISELKNCLSFPLYAAALLAWLRFEHSGRRLWYAISLFTFLLALAAKTSTVALPIVLLGLAWWRRGKIAWQDVLRSIPFFVFSLAMALATVWFQIGRNIGEEVVRPEGLLSRLAASGWVVWFYVYKAFLPLRLAMIYPRWDVDPTNAIAWLPLAALIALLTIFWRYRKSWGRPMIVALGYFVVTLGPVLGIIGMSFHQHSLVSDHFQYLALPAVTTLLAAAMVTLARFSRWRRIVMGAAMTLLFVCFVLTRQRAEVFQTQENLWRDTLAQNPVAFSAHNNLGSALADLRRFEEAVPHYQAALRIKPDFAAAHYNWGSALQTGLGRFAEAAKHFEEAVRIKPDFAEAQFNWGNSLQAQRRFTEAIPHYEIAVRLKPDFAEAYYNWGNALQGLGRFEDAVEHYQEAVRLNPDDAEAHYNWANALQLLGRFEEAVERYQEAVRIQPEFANAHNNLGKAFENLARFDKATTEYKGALRLESGNISALNNLAWLLATCFDDTVRDGPQAVRLAEQAARRTGYINPTILATLSAAHAEAGNFEQAVAWQAKAIDMARGEQKNVLSQRLEMYKQGKPYREEPKR